MSDDVDFYQISEPRQVVKHAIFPQLRYLWALSALLRARGNQDEIRTLNIQL